MMKIESLTYEQIVHEPLPIKDLLANSLYYPASGLDGGVVKYYSHKVKSFVYSDFSIGIDKFMREMDTFRGYKVFAHRRVQEYELNPNNKNIQFIRNLNQNQANTFYDSLYDRDVFDCYRFLPKDYSYQELLKAPFIHWVVYEREEQFDSDFGPDRFSLLFVGGEGVETYLKLYPPNKRTAEVLAIIQSGYGFGGNWTDFRKKNQALSIAVQSNEYGMPSEILYGGIGEDYEINPYFDWEGYEYSGVKICPYYSRKVDCSVFNKNYGEVTIWRRRNKT